MIRDQKPRLDARAVAAKFKADTEQAWKNPTIGARADDAPSFPAGSLQALAAEASKRRREEVGVPTAEEAAAAFRTRTEEAWRSPTVGTTSSSLLATAEEISARLGR